MGHIWLPPQGQVGHALEVACLVALTWTKGQVTPTPKRDCTKDPHLHCVTILAAMFGALALGQALWKHLPYREPPVTLPVGTVDGYDCPCAGKGDRLTQLVRPGAGSGASVPEALCSLTVLTCPDLSP